jgi:Family of unknown function (DUF6011)
MTNHFEGLGDDLDAAPMPARDPNAFENKTGHVEQCGKCKGTGRFVSWAGNTIGQCFACKGTGTKTFRTSKFARASAAQSRARKTTRKATDRAAEINAFMAAHPAVIEWMNASAASFPFAASMRDALAKYGSLTEKQLAACERCVAGKAKAIAARAEREANAPAINVAPIEAAFETAIAKHYRALYLGEYVFSLAGPNSKNPGAIYVKAGENYLGKIMGGKFLGVRACSPQDEAGILAACADPKTAAIEYGKRFRRCGVCHRGLTNDESIEAGIGPICAKKIGW